MVALAILVGVAAAIAAMAAALAGGRSEPINRPVNAVVQKPAMPTLPQRPQEIRGVHVTMGLAALPGKLASYLSLRNHGLNTIELDIKDESGQVAFTTPAVPLAKRIGAAHSYYNPYQVARLAHRKHVYLIGRVVVFEDPILSERMPSYALKNQDGSVWHTSAGLGWTNMYDTRVWKYASDLGLAAAKAGFDEIQFDYVRFPSDGDVWNIQYAHKVNEKKGVTIGRFAKYAAGRLHAAGVRVGADLFGLAAHGNLGIGQVPRKIARYVDTVSPMAYPSHYTPGEYNLNDPDATPGPTVFNTLKDFHRALRGRKAVIVPWLQDFSLGRTYTFADVKAQVDAARNMSAGGFLLWNPEGVYTEDALRPARRY